MHLCVIFSRVTSRRRPYILAESPYRLDRRRGKILVREEEGQSLGLLIHLDLSVNLFAMIGNERPGVHQIGCAKCGERRQDLGFCKTQPPIVLQRPHRDSRSGNSRITATNISRRLYS